MKEIVIRIANPNIKPAELGLAPFEIIINGVKQTHVNRFAIDLDVNKIPTHPCDPRGITYILEKHINHCDLFEDDSDHLRKSDDWCRIVGKD